jgi:hypothetical protein
LPPGAGAVLLVVAAVVAVVLTAATAAPLATVAVAISSKPNVLFNFMAHSSTVVEQLLPIVNTIGDLRITIYKAFHNYKG